MPRNTFQSWDNYQGTINVANFGACTEVDQVQVPTTQSEEISVNTLNIQQRSDKGHDSGEGLTQLGSKRCSRPALTKPKILCPKHQADSHISSFPTKTNSIFYLKEDNNIPSINDKHSKCSVSNKNNYICKEAGEYGP